MNPGGRVTLSNVEVRKIFEPRGKGPWLILVAGGDAASYEQVCGDAVGVKSWDAPKVAEGDVVDVSGVWDFYPEAKDETRQWSIKIHKNGAIYPSDGASPAASPAPAPARGGGKSLSEVIDDLEKIKAAVAMSSLAENPEDVRTYTIHINIMHERKPLTLDGFVAEDDDDVPF